MELDPSSCETSDGRKTRRYPLGLPMRYYIVRRQRVMDSGHGRTINISTGGLLVETPRRLPVGAEIELFVDWPAIHSNGAHLHLEVHGQTVRAEGNLTGISIARHDFLVKRLEKPAPAIPAKPLGQEVSVAATAGSRVAGT